MSSKVILLKSTVLTKVSKRKQNNHRISFVQQSIIVMINERRFLPVIVPPSAHLAFSFVQAYTLPFSVIQ